jgi:transcriptional regulator GlxA family with amidase domain
MRNVALLIFDDAEVLDFCGPFEVFSTTDELQHGGLLRVFTVALAGGAIRARNGLRVIPDFVLAGSPPPDIVLVPGGRGARAAGKEEEIIAWLKRSAGSAELLLSVCSGALILARAGLLDGLKATTHHEVLDELRSSAPMTEVIAGKRFIDNGRIIVSAGIAAGIDMCLYVVSRLFGAAVARQTAAYMEYDCPHPEVFAPAED